MPTDATDRCVRLPAAGLTRVPLAARGLWATLALVADDDGVVTREAIEAAVPDESPPDLRRALDDLRRAALIARCRVPDGAWRLMSVAEDQRAREAQAEGGRRAAHRKRHGAPDEPGHVYIAHRPDDGTCQVGVTTRPRQVTYRLRRSARLAGAALTIESHAVRSMAAAEATLRQAGLRPGRWHAVDADTEHRLAGAMRTIALFLSPAEDSATLTPDVTTGSVRHYPSDTGRHYPSDTGVTTLVTPLKPDDSTPYDSGRNRGASGDISTPVVRHDETTSSVRHHPSDAPVTTIVTPLKPDAATGSVLGTKQRHLQVTPLKPDAATTSEFGALAVVVSTTSEIDMENETENSNNLARAREADSDDSLPLAIRLTRAANAAVTAAIGEQVRPIRADSTHALDLARRVDQIGISAADAGRAIRRAAAKFARANRKAPSSMAYFIPVIESEHERLRGTPAPDEHASGRPLVDGHGGLTYTGQHPERVPARKLRSL